MKYPTIFSVLGSLLISNNLIYGWVILILANMLWMTKHLKENNKDSLFLHSFYLANAVYAVIKYAL